jgi:5-hydroxyisourate hydrolase
MRALQRGAQAGESMGRLTTHILDTAQGCPAAGVGIRLFAAGNDRRLIASTVSNADGRTDRPLLEGDAMTSGCYELEFDIGPYFADRGLKTGEPAFLGTVVIRFSIAAGEHYHVPLLASPWSYSTYRGS